MASAPLPARSARRPRAFARERSGASAVEFSILAFPFVAILIAILELGVDYLYFSQLDHATHKAAEEVRTGNVTASQMTADDFKNDLICPRLVGFDCSRIVINATIITDNTDWLQRVWAPGAVIPETRRWCLGSAEDVVALQVAYPMPLVSRIWSSAVAPSNAAPYYLSASGFRNSATGPSNPGCS